MTEATYLDDVEDIPGDNGTSESTVNIKSILDAPDYTEFVRRPKGAKAREYERKTAALVKSGMVASIQSGNLADAAACIHFGPGLAAAAGDFAASNERAAKMLDMVCTPGNPTVMFALAAIPMVGQLMRNHEYEVAQIPEIRRSAKMRRMQRKAEAEAAPRMQIRVPIIGKTISVRMRMKLKLLSNIATGFRKGTRDPAELTVKVFSDEKLQTALRKQGFDIRVTMTDSDVNA